MYLVTMTPPRRRRQRPQQQLSRQQSVCVSALPFLLQVVLLVILGGSFAPEVKAWTPSLSTQQQHRRPRQHPDASPTTLTSIRTKAITVTKTIQVGRSFSLKARHSDEEDDDDDDEDDEPPEIGDVQNFRLQQRDHNNSNNSNDGIPAFGLNRGRSSPAHRQALGKRKDVATTVYLCTNCGSESIQWMGRCPTCSSWNTLQEHAVRRQSSSASARPLFGSSSSRSATSSSWLDHLPNQDLIGEAPVRMSDLIQQQQQQQQQQDSTTNINFNRNYNRRLVVPDDDELNTVLGGGIVPGSLVLFGGDPGIGKSTLLLQAAGAVAAQQSTPTVGIGMGSAVTDNKNITEAVGPVWYVSGEETPAQVADRAHRLGIEATELYLLRETHVDALCAQIANLHYQQEQQSQQYQHRQARDTDDDDDDVEDDDDDTTTTWHHSQQSSHQHPQQLPPFLVVLDSIQTLVCDAAGGSAAGGITQVRECVSLLLRLAKSTNTALWLVGHVTKTGDVAGPRTVEHMVDAVLYLEGDNNSNGSYSNLRVLRASKNRFGSADAVGVYEMTSRDGRLRPVADPSALFLAHRQDTNDMEGCAIAVALEGRRAVTVEVQALVTFAGGGEGNNGVRRNVNGVDYNRLQLLLGVLQKRYRMFFSRQDVYVNVVGQLRLDGRGPRGEGHAADLAVAVALASSLYGIAVRADTAFVGEVGLLGELRTVRMLEKRLQEARRMGFSRVVTPRDYYKNSHNRKSYASNNGKRSRTTITRAHGMEWIQCETLQGAINEGLVDAIPKRQRRKKSKGPEAPDQLEDLGLDTSTTIMDDQDDEFDSGNGGFG